MQTPLSTQLDLGGCATVMAACCRRLVGMLVELAAAKMLKLMLLCRCTANSGRGAGSIQPHAGLYGTWADADKSCPQVRRDAFEVQHQSASQISPTTWECVLCVLFCTETAMEWALLSQLQRAAGDKHRPTASSTPMPPVWSFTSAHATHAKRSLLSPNGPFPPGRATTSPT